MPIHIPSALADAVKSRNAVLFAGAGISWRSVGFGGLHIRDEIGRLIQRDYPDYDPASRSLEMACDEFAVLNDRIGLVTNLAGLIPLNLPPQDSHLEAVKKFRFIVTTNWDLLFEAACSALNIHRQILCNDADAPTFNYDSHNILKIHGSADHPTSLIATSDDYENYERTHANLLQRIADLLRNNTVLFVGYGFGDEHIRHLLARIRAMNTSGWTRKAYAVGRYDAVRSALLKSRGIETIDADADDFLKDLPLPS